MQMRRDTNFEVSRAIGAGIGERLPDSCKGIPPLHCLPDPKTCSGTYSKSSITLQAAMP
jgi:hypothetical protein